MQSMIKSRVISAGVILESTPTILPVNASKKPEGSVTLPINIKRLCQRYHPILMKAITVQITSKG